jgi:mannosyltransferase
MPVVAALVALCLGLWRLTGAGLWFDEAATVSSAERSVPQLWHMTAHVDATHGVYYLLMHFDFALFGASPQTLRLPSALAGAATAGLLAATAGRLANRRAGLLAGLFWAVLPQISRYMQEGRSYAMVSLCVVAAAYCLTRRWWVGLAVAAGLASALNLLSVLALVAFAVTLVLWRLQGAAGNRAVVVATTSMAVAVLVGALPVALRGRGQSGLLDWITRPDRHTWTDLAEAMTGGHRTVIPVLAVAALGCLLALRRREERELAALALPLMVLPPVLLIGYSMIGEPRYVLRYVLYALVGCAWLVGLGLDAVLRMAGRVRGRLLGRRLAFLDAPVGLLAGTLAVAVVAVSGWSGQTEIRAPLGHADPLLQAAGTIRDYARPGDGVLFLPGWDRYARITHPDSFRNTKDLLLRTPAAEDGSLFGEDYPLTELDDRVKGFDRVWVLRTLGRQPAYAKEAFDRLREDHYRVWISWQETPAQQVMLWVKVPEKQQPQPGKPGKKAPTPAAPHRTGGTTPPR